MGGPEWEVDGGKKNWSVKYQKTEPNRHHSHQYEDDYATLGKSAS